MAKANLPRSLNICIVSKKFPMQGRAADRSYLFQVAKGLVQANHKVSILAASNNLQQSYIEQEGVQAHFLDLNNAMSDKAYSNKVKATFADLHYNEAFHIVHCVDKSAEKIIRLKDDLDINTLVDVDCTNLGQLFNILGQSQENLSSILKTYIALVYRFTRSFFSHDRKLLKGADGVIVNSPQQRIALERYFLYPDRKIHNIYYGIEIQNVEQKNTNEKLKASLNIDPESKVVALVTDMAELNEIKNVLKAFVPVVVKKPETRLLIIGHGPLRKEIEYEVYMLALGNKVIFTGAINNSEISDYISLSDIFVNISSRTNGFDPATLEAMAQKKIVIGSEVSAISSLIKDQVDGYLVRPADINTITNLLLSIINEQTPNLEIGDSARQKVLEFSDIQKMITDSINAYFAVLKASGKYKKNK